MHNYNQTIEQINSNSLTARALDFAAIAHFTAAPGGQKRKFSGLPYITHPIEVFSILAGITDDISLLCAALLHDVVEDTSYTLDDIQRHFGNDVTRLVDGVTKIEGNGELSRNALEKMTTAKIVSLAMDDFRISWLKASDVIANTRNAYSDNPDFAKVYLPKKQRLVQKLPDLHEDLAQELSRIFLEFEKLAQERA